MNAVGSAESQQAALDKTENSDIVGAGNGIMMLHCQTRLDGALAENIVLAGQVPVRLGVGSVGSHGWTIIKAG
jgi:hypothetical protein